MSVFDWWGSGGIERDSDGDVTGAQGGVGVLHGAEGSFDGRSGWINGRVGFGEQSDGTDYYGAQAAAQTGALSFNPAVSGESGFWGGVAGPRAGFDAYATDSTAGLGYVQNTVSGSVGYRQVGESDHDRGMCVGFGTGPLNPAIPGGMGVRAHYGDADDDGRREYGFGASLPLGEVGIPGTGSLDYVTETPLLDSVALMVLGAPVAGAAAAGVATGAKLDDAYDLSDRLAGVEGTSGTRGAPKFPSEMTPEERYFHQWFGG
ncbi:MAG: hypothetical protein KC464_13825 [Myxococcales bacterium]|nr:hypothetical protein [Myxococcales bacterium]